MSHLSYSLVVVRFLFVTVELVSKLCEPFCALLKKKKASPCFFSFFAAKKIERDQQVRHQRHFFAAVAFAHFPSTNVALWWIIIESNSRSTYEKGTQSAKTK